MRFFIVLPLVLLPAMLSGCNNKDETSSPVLIRPEAYNVVLISIDTLRADHLACYGYDRETAPCIERFAEKSVVFDRAYSQSPWTTPSHASLFTSLYPSVLNLNPWPNPGEISPKAYTLAELMRDHGYATAGFLEAGMVSSKFGFAQGFDPYKQGYKHIHESVPACLEWIAEQKEKRFFVFLHTYDVHRYDPPEEFKDLFLPEYRGPVEEGIPLARKLQDLPNYEFLRTLDENDEKKIISIYDEGIRYVDHWIGRFFDGLEAAGLMRKTVVLVTSDHGEEFWEHRHTGHGYTNFEEMLHIPLILYHPDLAPGRRGQLVRLLDIAPTVAELVGVPIKREWQGISFLNALKDTNTRGAQYSFAEQGHVDRKSVHNERWKLIRTYRDKPPPFIDHLYDMKNDPAESNDVADLYPEELEKLRELLLAWEDANQKLKKGYKALEVELDPELKKQLENLGYTGKDR
ncbi:MAG: sulfatase [Planctomycetota bacterium]